MTMKRMFTLCWALIAALAMLAQSDFPVQFADKDGNIIADGSTLERTTYVEDDFGEVQMPALLWVKNVSNEAIQIGGTYTIESISSGAFQTCFPANCVRKTVTGTFTTGNEQLPAGQLKDMQTEWFPTAEGTCTVTYQLQTYKQNFSGKWMPGDEGPKVTLNFNYNASAGVSQAETEKEVLTVDCYNVQGQRAQDTSSGPYIKKVTYTDGTTKTKKHFSHHSPITPNN